jgi:mannosyltransferase OCH1-like enzyme
LIWVGKSEQPEYLQKHIAKWIELMPDWDIRLWTNDHLIEEKIDIDVLSTIHKAEKGTQKADILKYYIVWKFGGVYVDADVYPVRSLDPILYMSDLVICHGNYITWPYISVGFFAASIGHPVLQKSLDICLKTELNTNDPHMTTGPRAFGEAVSIIPPLNMKYMMLPTECFYYHDPQKVFNPSHKFGQHFYAKSWHT